MVFLEYFNKILHSSARILKNFLKLNPVIKGNGKPCDVAAYDAKKIF